jgi:hydrogenase/urease accessory protein HupE
MPPRTALSVVAAVAVLLGVILGYRSGVNMAHTAVGDQFILGVSLTGLIVGALLAAVMTSERSSYDTDTGLPPISVHFLMEVHHGQ